MTETATRAPLEIVVGRQTHEYVYQLHPSSHARIIKKYPNAKLIRNVVIGFETVRDLQEQHESIGRQIAMLLTGMNWSQIERMGGVRIVDPDGEEVLWEADAGAASAR